MTLVPPNDRSDDHSMLRTIAHYEFDEQIGQGTYGSVYRAKCKDTGRIVAMKKMKIHHGGYWGMPLQLIREIKLLCRLRHPNLVRMVEVVTSKGVEHLDPNDNDEPITHRPSAAASTSGGDAAAKTKSSGSAAASTADIREKYKGNLFLVLEYVDHDLTGLLDVNFPFSAGQIQSIFRQLLSALEYLHSQKYVHRDIKSSNILLDGALQVHLADFGLARSLEAPLVDQVASSSLSSTLSSTQSSLVLTNKVITLWYRPPEILLGAVHYNTSVDIWSAGCILAELLLGKALLPGKSDLEQLLMTLDLLGPPTRDTWDYIQGNLLAKSTSMPASKGTGSSSSTTAPNPAIAALDYDKLVEHYEQRQGGGKTTMSKLRAKYVDKIPGPALNLLERMLDWDPRKRITAAQALDHRYFFKSGGGGSSQSPMSTVDDQPVLALLLGGHFHEFQTKKKRRQAKAIAEEQKQAALLSGASLQEADEQKDVEYRRLMKQVADHGLDSFDVTGAAAEDANQVTNEVEAEEEADVSGRRRSSKSEHEKRERRRSRHHREDDSHRDGRERRRRRDRDSGAEDESRRKRRRSDSDHRRDSDSTREEEPHPDESRRREQDEHGQPHDRRPPPDSEADWRREGNRGDDPEDGRRREQDENVRPHDRRPPPDSEADWRREGNRGDDPEDGRRREQDENVRPHDRRPPTDFEADWRREGDRGDGPEDGRRPEQVEHGRMHDRRPPPDFEAGWRREGDRDDLRRRERDFGRDSRAPAQQPEPRYERGRGPGPIMDERPRDAPPPRENEREWRRERNTMDDRPIEGRGRAVDPLRQEGGMEEGNIGSQRSRESDHRRGRESPRSHDGRQSRHRQPKKKRRRKDRGDRRHGQDDRRDRERGSRQGGDRDHERGPGGRDTMNRDDRGRERFRDDGMPPAVGPGGQYGPYGPQRDAGAGCPPQPPRPRPPPRDDFAHYGPANDRRPEPRRDERGPRNRDRRR